ncbi:uncharacterized protein LOC106457641 isoform X2 [Limulus polyphemus]|uniref:Uncharacterized protein LOC106457641 isoform X2 n=1 Tax=Limulus polyphemus TaxID=6850 RepID=A0ABM1S6U2_LIMPO|nr:uncharacterized protein LOC106457641 isoform X2 [Limulus polyphemus]
MMMVSKEQHQKTEVQPLDSHQQVVVTEVKQWWPGLRRLVLRRDETDFGFTLRHFIIYPLNKNQDLEKKEHYTETSECNNQRQEAMDTIFVREVKEGSPAHTAGLVIGDRIVSVNGHPITGKTYSEVIGLIHNRNLDLLVVPKEEDILQLYFSNSAYQPVERITSGNDNSSGNQEIILEIGDNIEYEEQFKRDEFCLKEPTDKIRKFQYQDFATNTCEVESEDASHGGRDAAKQHGYSHIKVTESTLSSTVNNSHKISEANKNPVNLIDAEDHVNGSFNFYQEVPLHFDFGKKQESPFRLTSNESDRFAYSYTDIQSLQVTDSSFQQSLAPQTKSRKEGQDTMNELHRGVVDKHMFKGIKSHSLITLEGERNDGSVLSTIRYPILQQCCPYGRHGSEEIVDTLSEPSSRSLTPDVTRSQHVSSFHLIDQRCHQFEPSYLLARQLERINIHRSELAKMSPHHPIMTLRAGKFQGREVMSDSETASPSSFNHRALPKPHHQIVGLKCHPTTWTGFREFSQKKLPSRLDTPVSIIKEKEQQLTVYDDIAKMKDIIHEDDDRATSDQPFISQSSSKVVLRKKPPIGEVPLGRRVSYLKATARERIDMDSDVDYSDEEEDHSIISDQSAPSSTHQLQKLRSFHGEKTPEKVKASETREAEDECMERQGWLACKALTVEGKRSSDRSWRPVWAVLNAEMLYLLKERRDPSEVGPGIEDTHIPVKSSIAGVAHDYTKKKHVFRLRLPGGTEYLLQADTHVQMIEWLAALQHIKMEDHEDWLNEPTSVLEKAAVFELQQLWNTMGRLSPLPRPIKKFALRHRSPSGTHAPKTRRASHTDEVPKSVAAWRGRVVHGLKMFNSTPAKGTRSGLRLEQYQGSQNNQFVPLIVDLCIGIVETRGLDTVGIYRVPGNNAAVSLLINAVNQQTTTIDLQDAHWNDVNVVSSLLKAFFRRLSEPLFTSSLYPQFIAASKLDNPASKLQTIHQLIHLLPRHYFETLKCIMSHLKKVAIHANNNKMEARNLAIVFGPTLVRSADNNMVALVTDMPHQCCITETIIKNAEWLFTKSPTENLANLPDNYVKRSSEPLPVAEQEVLLQNIRKIDGGTAAAGISGREFVSSLMSAAHQKVWHRQKKAAIHADEQIISNEKKYSVTGRQRKFLEYQSLEPTMHKPIMSQFMFVPWSHEKSLKLPKTLPDMPIMSDNCSSFTSLSSFCTSELASDQGDSDSQVERRTKEKRKPFEKIDDGVVLHTYEEVSALTKERIKSFEQETRAILQRDIYKHQEKSSHHQMAREQIEREWRRAKQEIEQDDLLDQVADNPSFFADLYSDQRHVDQHRRMNCHNETTKEVFTTTNVKKPQKIELSTCHGDSTQSSLKHLSWTQTERISVPGEGGLVSEHSRMLAQNFPRYSRQQNHPQMKKYASTNGTCGKVSTSILTDQKALPATTKHVLFRSEARKQMEHRSFSNVYLPEAGNRQNTTSITTSLVSSGIPTGETSATVCSQGTHCSSHQFVGSHPVYLEVCGRSQSMESTVSYHGTSNTLLHSNLSHSGEVIPTSLIPSSSGISPPLLPWQQSNEIGHTHDSQYTVSQGDASRHLPSHLLSCYQHRHTKSSSVDLDNEQPVLSKKVKM